MHFRDADTVHVRDACDARCDADARAVRYDADAVRYDAGAMRCDAVRFTILRAGAYQWVRNVLMRSFDAMRFDAVAIRILPIDVMRLMLMRAACDYCAMHGRDNVRC
jgi:hypothetical protein